MKTANIIDLERIDEYREDNQIEAKAAQGGLPETFWDSYSAFANTDGGCILLGVKERDDHSLQVIGLKNAEKMKKDFILRLYFLLPRTLLLPTQGNFTAKDTLKA